MTQKHKYAEFIKAWLDGKEVEMLWLASWIKIESLANFDYVDIEEVRLKLPDWQRKLLDAVKNGETCEYLNESGVWVRSHVHCQGESHNFGNNPYRYRIFQEQAPDTVQFVYVESNGHILLSRPYFFADANMQLIFDGNTKQLKEAVLLNK